MSNSIEQCPYCGSEKLRIGYQIHDGEMVSDYAGDSGCRIIHKICVDCGSIVHSSVEKPEIFDDDHRLS